MENKAQLQARILEKVSNKTGKIYYQLDVYTETADNKVYHIGKPQYLDRDDIEKADMLNLDIVKVL